MSKGLFDDHKINITCANCGQKHPKAIAWIKAHRELACSCGTRIKIEADQFVSGLRQADKSFDNLRQTLRSLSKKRR